MLAGLSSRLQPSCTLCQLARSIESSRRWSSKNSFSLFEPNKKGVGSEKEDSKWPEWIAYNIHNFKPEFKKFWYEQTIGFKTGVILKAEHGNYQDVYRFDSIDKVSSWIVSTDKDNKGGFSTADFELSKNKTGVFYGNLSTEVPKDGVTKYAGWANVSSPKIFKSFRRESSMDWSLFNCMLVKARGDGRPYRLTLGCDFDIDVGWLDRWVFPLYTRGGPYWQVAKIPFGKFYMSNRGRIQDAQHKVPLDVINLVGITVTGAEGPFRLEIDSISVMYDETVSTNLFYELYKDKNLLGQT